MKASSPTPTSSKWKEEELVVKFSKGKTFLEELGVVRPELAFREDAKGDDKLAKASGLPAHLVANYKARPKFALGGSDLGSFESRKDKQKHARFYSKTYLKSFLSQDGIIDLASSERKEMVDEKLDVIKLEGSESFESAAGSSSSSNPLGIYDPATTAYLSGESSSKGVEGKDPESFKLHRVQEKTKEFNERLRESPNDIDLWLAFVDFQDVSFEDAHFSDKDAEAGQSKKKKAAKNVVLKQRALVEKKLSILKAALDKNPKSTELAVKRLELSRELLETSVLDRQWKELIFLFPKNFELWRYYLRFVSSYFTSFSVSKVIKAYRTCFSKLRQVQSQSFLTPDRPENLESQMRIVLASLCHFLSRSGFREKGTALFQAMLELNLFSPDFPGYYSLDDRLALFEPFWESRVPRFGEDGARGWRTVMKNKTVEVEEDVAANEDDEASWEMDLLEKAGGLAGRNALWLEIELSRERKHWLPWRTGEEDPEDPDRMVPFEDINPFLFQFNEREQRLYLLLNFADFLGVPMEEDCFFFSTVGSETISRLVGSDDTDVFSSDVDFQPDVNATILQRTGPDVLQDSKFQSFCRSTFSQASKVLPEPCRTAAICLWLRLEQKIFSETPFANDREKKSMRKELKALVKELLQKDQKNVNIYIEYARLEYKLDGFSSAWKVLQSVMTSFGDVANEAVYTCATCVVLHELKNGENSEEKCGELSELATWLLTLAGLERGYKSKDKLDRTVLLDMASQAKEAAKSELHSRLSSGKVVFSGEEASLALDPVNFVPSFLHKAFIACWLDYFTGEDPLSGFELLKTIIKKLNADECKESLATKLISENLHKLGLDLLTLAAKSDQLLARVCRRHLRFSLAAFPCSRYLLQHLCALSVRPSVVDATWRSFISQTIDRVHSISPLPQVYAVKVLVKQFALCQRTEEHESASLASSTYLHRAKALLESFLSREPGRYSPAMWRLLLWVTSKLEESGSGTDMATSTVFYRGLQDCPSSKALFVDFVKYKLVGRGAEKSAREELGRVLDILVEKEGRTRLPLEELEVLLEKEEGGVSEEEEELEKAEK